MEILIKRLSEKAKMPVYSHEARPGIEIYALDKVTLAPGAKVIVSTGVEMAMPVGYVGLIWSRSSLVTKEDIRVTAGMIDSGCREEIMIEVTNTGNTERTIEAGETVAQILVQAINHARLIEAEDLSGSDS